MQNCYSKYGLVALCALWSAFALTMHAAKVNYLPAEGKVVLNWYDYSNAGKKASYDSNYATSVITSDGEPYDGELPRSDVEGLVIAYVDDGGELDGFAYPGSCLTGGESTYDFGEHPASWRIPKSQALARYGQWFRFVVYAREDCWASINIVTAGSLAEANQTYVESMTNDEAGHKVTGMGDQNWVRRYGQAYVLSLDGENLKTTQKSYPEMFKERHYMNNNVSLVNSHGMTNEALHSRTDFLMLLHDKARWTSSLLPDGTPNDTLFTWPQDVYLGNDKWSPGIVKYEEEKVVRDQYRNVFLSKGQHIFVLKKLAFAGNSWRSINLSLTKEDVYIPRMGDVNGDRYVDVSDLVLLATYALGEEVPPEWTPRVADLNDDNIIDVSDVVVLANRLSGEYYTD